MRKLLLNPTPLFRKLRQLSLLLTLLLALPQTAWGQGSNQVSKTYTFKVTTLSGNTGTATSDITGGTVAETYTWNIKDFSRTIGSVAYTNGTVTPSNSKLGFSGDGIGRKLENGNYYAVQTTFVLESEAFTGEFVSATIEGYSSTGMSTAQVQVLRDEGTTASPLSYGENQHGYTTLSSTTSLPMSTSEVHTSNKYLNGNKLRFIFMFVSDNQSNNASFEIGSITITTIPLTPLEINYKNNNNEIVVAASYTFGSNDNLPRLKVSDDYVGTITYTSSNENVATVDITGGVTPITSGEAIITATAPTTESFIGGTASYTLTVNKATPTISFTKWGTNSYNGETVADGGVLEATYGVAFKAPKPTFSNGEGLNDSTRFVYSYSVDGVVEFPNNGESTDNPGKIIYGEISLLKAGTVTITCTFPGNMQNNSCSASYTLTIAKGTPTLSFGEATQMPTYEATYGQAFTAPTLTKPEDVSPTFASSNTAVATVDAATGAVTIVSAGTTTITASFAGNDNYNAATDASYTLNVKPSAPTLSLASGAYYVGQELTVTPTITGEGISTTLTVGETQVSSPYSFGTVGSYTSSAKTIYNAGAPTLESDEVTATYVINNKPTFTATIGNNPYNEEDPASGNVSVSLAVSELQANCVLMYYLGSDKSKAVSYTAQFALSETSTVNAFIRYTNPNTQEESDTEPVSKTFIVKLNLALGFGEDISYKTFYLEEYSLKVPTGLKAYLITGVSGQNVTTQETDIIPKEVPVLLEKTGTTESFTAETYSGTLGDYSGNKLKKASSDGEEADGNNYYVLYKNEFVKATGTINGACYLDLNGVAPTRGMYGIGNDGSTAIEGIDVEATKDEEWYDLQGRRIQKPTKAGIYIVNGKKVIINNK